MQGNPKPTPGLALFYPQQLHFEYEGAVGWDFGARAIGTVCQVGRYGKLELVSHLHELESLRPAGYDRVQGEADRLSALDGTVEYGAIKQGAVVVHLHGIGGFGRNSAGALLEDLVLKSARGGFDFTGLAACSIGGRARSRGRVVFCRGHWLLLAATGQAKAGGKYEG